MVRVGIDKVGMRKRELLVKCLLLAGGGYGVAPLAFLAWQAAASGRRTQKGRHRMTEQEADQVAGYVFAAFPTEQAARQVWNEAPAGMQGFIARGLARHPLRDLAR